MTPTERFLLWIAPPVARWTLFAQRATGLTSPQLALGVWALCVFLPGLAFSGGGHPLGAMLPLTFWVLFLRYGPETSVEVRCWRARWDPGGIPTSRMWVTTCIHTADAYLHAAPGCIFIFLVGSLVQPWWGGFVWASGGALLWFLMPLVAAVPTLPPEERVLDLTQPLPGES